MVGLVCIDVDGTLVGSSGQVAPEVWRAAAAVRDGGVPLALCSGRPAIGLAREFAARLDPAGWHVFQNGASLRHLPTCESRSRAIPPHAVEWLVARTRETGRLLELYTDNDYAVESTEDRAVRHAALLGVPFRTRAFRSLDAPVVRAQWLLAHAEVDAVLAEAHPDLHLSPSHSPVMEDTTFLNMTAPDTDKASAVRTLAAAYDVPLERVMMVGDGANDVEVMRVVGFPVAMGNAEEAVHRVARHRVGHVDEGGLIEALALVASLVPTL
jgi:Cof subfamily protein (haloacid dehalogenase superfamily)